MARLYMHEFDSVGVPASSCGDDLFGRIVMQRWEGTRWQAIRRRLGDWSHFLFCERSGGCYGHYDGGRYVPVDDDR